MRIINVTIEDVFKDAADGKSLSGYFILTLSNCEDKNRIPTIQTKSVESTTFKDLQKLIAKENRCLIRIESE